MVCRNGRIILPEILDTLPASEAVPNLADLVRINRWFGGHWTLTRLLRSVVKPGESFTMLDVGAASGDMGAAARKRFPGARVTSLDYLPEHLSRAANPRVAADAFRLPFAPRSFDIVFCSLFLHHFDDRRVADLLAGFGRLARRAVVVIDLERHPLAYHFLPATRWLLGWHSVTVHDGCRSVEAGFHPDELRALASEAGLHAAIVRRHLPWFRLSIVARLAD